MRKYCLKNEGDSFEQKFCIPIIDEFPNYEVFWDNFIVSWTNRDILPKTDMRWVQFRINVPQFIEELCMIHYSVFRDLAFFVAEIMRYGNESLRTIYTHFGHAIEMAYLLAVRIQIAKKEVGIITEDIFIKESKNVLIEKFGKFLEGDYDKRFKDYESKQIPIFFPVQGTRYFMKKFVKNNSDYKELMKYFSSVQDYRNRFIHSPLPGTLFFINSTTGDRIRTAIKKDKLDKYRLWTDIIHHQNDPDDFIPENDFIVKEFKDLKKNLNLLWQYYIGEMKIIYDTEELQRYLAMTETSKGGNLS